MVFLKHSITLFRLNEYICIFHGDLCGNFFIVAFVQGIQVCTLTSFLFSSNICMADMDSRIWKVFNPFCNRYEFYMSIIIFSFGKCLCAFIVIVYFWRISLSLFWKKFREEKILLAFVSYIGRWL